MNATARRNFRDPRRYRLLLGRTMPVAIETEEESARMLAAARRLMAKGDCLTPEEGRLLKLLAILIEDYEQRNFALAKTPSHEMVRYLLEEKGLRASNLWPVIGSKGRVSDLLSGRRAISKLQAIKLAAFFGVSVSLFL